METETVEVVEPEIVHTEEKDSHIAGNIAIVALAALGVAKVGKFAAKRLPFAIVRKTSEPETPVEPAPATEPVVAE